MNALLTAVFTRKPLPPASRLPCAGSTRLVRRERDFGIGYGRSSGYGCTRRYTSDWAQPRFRCA